MARAEFEAQEYARRRAFDEAVSRRAYEAGINFSPPGSAIPPQKIGPEQAANVAANVAASLANALAEDCDGPEAWEQIASQSHQSAVFAKRAVLAWCELGGGLNCHARDVAMHVFECVRTAAPVDIEEYWAAVAAVAAASVVCVGNDLATPRGYEVAWVAENPAERLGAGPRDLIISE